MFPSELAWELFERLTQPPVLSMPESTGDSAGSEAVLETLTDSTPVEVSEPISTVVVVDPPPTLPTEPSPAPGAAEQQAVAAAIEKIHALLADIDDGEAELAQLSAERQRLWLLIWICDARVFESELPWAQGVSLAVARVARRLGDLAKVFWPGSVRPLQAAARPSEIGLGRRQGESLPSTWAEAGTLVRHVLNEQLAGGKKAGLDEDGWADGAALEPRPRDPDTELEELSRELQALLPAPASPLMASFDGVTFERLGHLARTLRWLRRGVRDPIRWGLAMGRLRHGASLLGDRADVLRTLCDARYRPPQPWARLVVRAPTTPPQSAPVEPLGEPPPVGSDAADVVVWLVRAFDSVDGPKLAEILTPRRDEICALDEAALPPGDRRIRRRFRELVHRLSAKEGELPEDPPSEREHAQLEPEHDSTDTPASGLVFDELCARIASFTRGKRVLLVTNREDPPLITKLRELLGVDLSSCDGSPRRIQAECTRIANRTFDLVLFAEGFQSHNVDAALVHATRAAGVPLVRVGRGRPHACVRAIARELGLGLERAM